MSTKCYGWSLYEDGDDGWYGAGTREEAIEEGAAAARERLAEDRAHGVDNPHEEAHVFYINGGERPDPAKFLPLARGVIDDMIDRACDECELDEPLEVNEAAEKELQELLEAWARKNVKCNWWEPGYPPERHEVPR